MVGRRVGSFVGVKLGAVVGCVSVPAMTLILLYDVLARVRESAVTMEEIRVAEAALLRWKAPPSVLCQKHRGKNETRRERGSQGPVHPVCETPPSAHKPYSPRSPPLSQRSLTPYYDLGPDRPQPYPGGLSRTRSTSEGPSYIESPIGSPYQVPGRQVVREVARGEDRAA